jgi:hypothetical protein
MKRSKNKNIESSKTDMEICDIFLIQHMEELYERLETDRGISQQFIRMLLFI